MLGPLDVAVDGAPPPAELLWRKNLALLVYLARSPRRTRTREHLVGVLWADKPESSARHSLSEALRVLRKVLGEDGVAATGDAIRLADGAVRLDTEDCEARGAAQDWAGAAALVAGEFCEGFAVPDASAFETWLAAERDEWRRRGVDVLVRASAERRSVGDLTGALAAAERALRLAPTADAAARAVMLTRALAGDRAGAVACFDAFAERLRAEVGAEPDADTARLAERVRRERVWRGVPAAAAAAATDRRAPLVGRGRELAALLDAWRRARDTRRAGVVVITGDPGTGTTRLLDEVLAHARLDGAAVAATRAVEADAADPGGGVWALGRAGLGDAAGVAGAPAAALAAFAARLPEWGDRFPAARSAAAAAPAAALADVVRAAALEQPVVLACDDAQWLDRESWLALVATLRDAADAPLLVALAASEHAPNAELDALRRRVGADLPGAHVRLEPLPIAELRALAGWALPSYGGDDLDRVARRLAMDTAGLPLLAVEILHAVVHGLDLRQAGAAWPAPLRTLDQTMPGDLPDTAVAAVRIGFRRLSADAQRVLAAAAVLEERAPAARLGRAAGLAGETLDRALDQLEWGRWLASEPRGYAFVARIVRAIVARDMLTAGQRQRLIEAAGPPPP